MTNKIYEGNILDDISTESQHSRAFLRQFSNELFNAIRHGLLEDGHVRLHQFGSFKLKWTNQRQGINPQTGAPIIINAHPRIIFAASKALKNKLPLSENTLYENNELNDIKSAPIINNTATPEIKRKSPLPDLDTPPYLINRLHKQEQANNKITISLKAMAAGFISLFIVVYLIYPTPVIVTKSEPEIAANTSIMLINTNPESLSETNKIASNALQNEIPPVTNSETEPSESNPAIFFAAKKHKLVNGNSLWRLSKKHYINPFYWPHIYQANRYRIQNPDKLNTGKIIDLPTLYGHPDRLTSVDKQNIAEGYFLAYKYYRKTNKPYPYYALIGATKYDPSIIERHIYEIADEDWESLQLASN